MKTIRMTTAQAIVRFLKNQFVRRDGVEHRLIPGVFGIFGHGNVAGLGQALEEMGGSDLPFFQPKNEQAMVHTAIAFAKARRGMGTLACTTSVGPGATNMVTGAATATINRLPVLLLPGDIFSNRHPAPVLQQLENPTSMDMSVNDCFKPVSKYWDRINRPEQILYALPEAMRVLADPALCGAVTICLPEDVQAEAYDYPTPFFDKRVYHVGRICPEEALVDQAASMIRSAQNPIVVVGGGALYSEAEMALKNFCDSIKIAAVCTQAGKSVLPETHPLCLGSVGTTGNAAANQMASLADLVLCVGTRLSDFTTASKTQFQNPNVKFVSINLNSFDAYKHGALALVGDARATLDLLTQKLQGHKTASAYLTQIMGAREKWDATRHELMTTPKSVAGPSAGMAQAEMIGVMNRFVENLGTQGAVIVHAAGGLPGDLHKLWKSTQVGEYHSEYGYSCMGYEIAGALGVKMAQPDREVYALLGDGSYLMLNHEIVTSLQEQKKITVVMNDNHGYQCIHNLQRGCGGRSFGNEFRYRDNERTRLEGAPVAIDFVKNAESLGATVFRAKDAGSLQKALESARAETKTCFIYVEVDPRHGLPGYSWWDVPMAEKSDVPSVQEARSQYEKSLNKKQFYY